MATSTTGGVCLGCGEARRPVWTRRTMKGYVLWRCPACGLEALDPQPDDQTLARIYQEEYYDAWGIREDNDLTRGLKRGTFADLLRPALQGRGAAPKLLDCGAATGFLMEEAAALGAEPYGVELSDFGAASIAERFGPERVFRGPFERAEFAGADRDFFDVVTMIDFLEHVRDPTAVLGKAFDLLKPGGSLVILTPNAASMSRRLMGLRWLHYKIEHLFYFTPMSLCRALERAGFGGMRVGRAWKVMNLHYVAHQLGRYPHPVLTPVASLLHRFGPAPLRRAMVRVSFGELLATASKPAWGGTVR